MWQPFSVAFRESAQSAFILTVVYFYLRALRGPKTALIASSLFSAAAGVVIGSLPALSRLAPSGEFWTFWRYVIETAVFYSGIVFFFIRSERSYVLIAGAAMIGIAACFFEARAVSFLVHDMGVMTERSGLTAATAIAGAAAGFLPFLGAGRFIGRIPVREALSFPSLLMSVGALKFSFGGVGEIEKGNILIDLQTGLLGFIGEGMKFLRSSLLFGDNPLFDAPLSGLFSFLGGDRTAMTLTVVFLMAPPLFLLVRLFGLPDPLTDDKQVAARRRLSVAAFRKDLLYQTIPVMTSLFALIVFLHQVNVSANPLYDPAPIPVREEPDGKTLRIPLSCRLGNLSDGKVMKYVYYYGNKQVIFLVIMKPDGSLGVALDECEICRPAEWNKDAWGYAQRGTNLVCKYCMTPIAIPTINNPGGCNPIPLPFRSEADAFVISIEDLIRVYKKTKELEKTGTHF